MLTNAIEIVKKFVEAQGRLCRETSRIYDLEDDDVFDLDAPRFGTIQADGTSWNFQKHGAGMRFTSSADGRIVDAHKNFVSRPESFDAWRVYQFCESLNISNIEFEGVSYVLDTEGGVATLLTSLERAGSIRSVDGEYALYELVS